MLNLLLRFFVCLILIFQTSLCHENPSFVTEKKILKGDFTPHLTPMQNFDSYELYYPKESINKVYKNNINHRTY